MVKLSEFGNGNGRWRLDELLPYDKFTAMATRIRPREDSRYPGYNAIYMDMEVSINGETRTFTQKFREMHVNELLKPAMQELKEAGIIEDADNTDELEGLTLTYEKKVCSFSGAESRWIPVPPDGDGDGKKRRTRKKS